MLTSPTVATIGMSITIPLAMMSDALLKGARPDPTAIIGAMLVLIGFTMVNISREAQADIDAWWRQATDKISRRIRGSIQSEYQTVET